MGLLELLESLFAKKEVVFSRNGTKHWYYNERLHRKDGPAIEYANGGYEWYWNGELHRADGPAMEFYNGEKVWYLNGKMIKSSAKPQNAPKSREHNWLEEGF